ncbi:MAG: aldehyde dehydrogenase family protein [Deltaproteobacteria bacterium]
MKQKMIIGGAAVAGSGYFELRNPYDGSLLAEVPQAEAKEVKAAIASAAAAQVEMAALPAHRRADILLHVVKLLATHKEELARTISMESGKPMKFSTVEVDRAMETFRFAAEEAKMIHGETIPMSAARGGENRVAFFERFPIGPIGAITPFNFPLNLVAHKLGPAIAAGNAFVLKPAEQTPLTALKLADILLQAGVPAKAVNVVTGDGRAGAFMVPDERLRMISFTGSPPVGREIKKRAGVKRVALELGSNSGVILEQDTDLDLAVERCLHGSFYNSGQVCISLQRIYLHADIHEAFREKLTARVAELTLGDPLKPNTDIGPLIDQGAAARTAEWLEEASQAGARVVCGGRVHDHNIFEPTIIENASAAMKVVCNEVFAPLVSLTPYTDFEAALAALNNSVYGLHAGIFTRDISKAFKAFRTLEVGGVIINDIPTYRSDHMPYGGVKESGLGREGVKYAIEEMTEIKTLVFSL